MLLIQERTAGEKISIALENYYDEFLNVLPRIALGIFIVVAGILIAQVITNFFKRRFLKKHRTL